MDKIVDYVENTLCKYASDDVSVISRINKMICKAGNLSSFIDKEKADSLDSRLSALPLLNTFTSGPVMDPPSILLFRSLYLNI